jgi:hypothetical protein
MVLASEHPVITSRQHLLCEQFPSPTILCGLLSFASIQTFHTVPLDQPVRASSPTSRLEKMLWGTSSLASAGRSLMDCKRAESSWMPAAQTYHRDCVNASQPSVSMISASQCVLRHKYSSSNPDAGFTAPSLKLFVARRTSPRQRYHGLKRGVQAQQKYTSNRFAF